MRDLRESAQIRNTTYARLEQIGQSVEVHADQNKRRSRAWGKTTMPAELPRHVRLVAVATFEGGIGEPQGALVPGKQPHRALEPEHGRKRLERHAQGKRKVSPKGSFR